MFNDRPSKPIDRALWHIESRYGAEITLDDVARAAGLSRFHLTRAFGMATGHSIMRYVRARRLSEAARRLAGGAPDILALALDSGYSSHEAFTRAFRDQFGVTPEEVRASRDIDSLNLLEPIHMNEQTFNELDAPRFIDGPAMLIAGLSERFDYESSARIPGLWQRFAPHIGHIPGQKGGVAYGVCHNSDDSGSIDYLAGVEVEDFSRLPKDFTSVRIPAHRYAVFTHRGHISAIRRTWMTIFNQWMPASGFQASDAPSLERYDQRFDPVTGNGELEIWVPVS